MSETLSILTSYLKTKYNKKFRSRETLEKWQNKKVKKFIRNIIKVSPFYSNKFNDFNIEEWRNSSIIDKKIMMDNFDSLNTANIKKEEAFKIAFQAEESRNFSPMIGNVTVGLSSGTSGNRGLFLVGNEERSLWAGNILGKVLPSSIFSSQKIAFFLRANSNLYTTIDKGKLKFEFFDLLSDMENHISKLNTYQPSIIVAPPSMLRLIAQEKEKGIINVNPIKVISVAEVLDPLDEIYLKKIFKQNIHQIYQCTEGFLATTCSHGTLHLNEDILVIEKEYIDKELGKFSPIITDFSRTTQPIIRYRLNDILTEKKSPCSCGSVFTALEHIEGRCDDLFYLEVEGNSGEFKSVFPDFIRRAIISSSDEIIEYKVYQTSVNEIEIAIKTEGNIQDIFKSIQLNFQDITKELKVKEPLLLLTEYQDSVKGVKLKRVERRFNLDEYKHL